MDYEAQSRSNHFRVRDPERFKEWAASRLLNVRVGTDGRYVIWSEDSWPSYNDETGEDFELEHELRYQLADNEVAILMEVGWEGMRYLVGAAWVVPAANLDYPVQFMNLTQWSVTEARKINPRATDPEY